MINIGWAEHRALPDGSGANAPPGRQGKSGAVRFLTQAQFKAHAERGAVMIDARDTAAFGGVHIPGSINIGLAKQTAKRKNACDLW